MQPSCKHHVQNSNSKGLTVHGRRGRQARQLPQVEHAYIDVFLQDAGFECMLQELLDQQQAHDIGPAMRFEIGTCFLQPAGFKCMRTATAFSPGGGPNIRPSVCEINEMMVDTQIGVTIQLTHARTIPAGAHDHTHTPTPTHPHTHLPFLEMAHTSGQTPD